MKEKSGFLQTGMHTLAMTKSVADVSHHIKGDTLDGRNSFIMPKVGVTTSPYADKNRPQNAAATLSQLIVS